MLNFLRKLIPERHPLRLLYHKLISVMAAVYYGFPASKLVVVGVTGTNGKSTTVNVVAKILTTAGYKVGMTSTIGFQVGDEKWVNRTKQSSVSPFMLQKMLKRMVQKGCKYAILEVTSHAMDQSRTFGVNFDVAVLTNITADHLEYHGSFNDYLQAKGKLFKKISNSKRKPGVSKTIVLNADDKYYNYFNQFVVDRKISYGLKAATVYAENVQKSANGSKFILHIPNHAEPINLKMPGEFNVYNALAAVSVCLALQLPVEQIKKGLELNDGVDGRFESVDCGQNFSVIVDYAHTQDALENLFKMYRSLTPGRLFGVFGATGGGRDKLKRPKMGAAVNEFADYIIVTDDDPYSEDEWEIIDQVAEGIPRKEGSNFWKIPDRKEAIRLALTMASEGDTVVIAGKGAEEVMMLRGKKIEWNDRKVVEELLNREVHVELSA